MTASDLTRSEIKLLAAIAATRHGILMVGPRRRAAAQRLRDAGCVGISKPNGTKAAVSITQRGRELLTELGR